MENLVVGSSHTSRDNKPLMPTSSPVLYPTFLLACLVKIPRGLSDIPGYLPAGLTQCVVNNYTIKSPPYKFTVDDHEVDVERIEVERITDKKLVHGRVENLAVTHEIDWKGLIRPLWEREMDLQQSCRFILDYWVRKRPQSRSCKCFYRCICTGAAAHELAGEIGGALTRSVYAR